MEDVDAKVVSEHNRPITYVDEDVDVDVEGGVAMVTLKKN